MSKYPATFAERRSDLAQIHMMAVKLGIDTKDPHENSEYRAMLFAITRKRSAAGMDWRERKMVIDHMGDLMKARKLTLGFAGKPTSVKPELQPLMGKIGALLADMKLPWAYAAKILKTQTSAQGKGIERLEWANAQQLHAVVTALVKRQAKLMECAVSTAPGSDTSLHSK